MKVAVAVLLLIGRVYGLYADDLKYGLYTKTIRNEETGQYVAVRTSMVTGTVSVKSLYRSFTIPYKVRFTIYGGKEYVDAPVTGFTNQSLERCYNLQSVTFNSRSVVSTIGDFTFAYCTSLSDIALPKTVETIGRAAFHSCWGLKSFVLPPLIQKIEIATFSDCVNLTSFTFNTKVNAIDNYAFYGCTSLLSIDIPYSVRTIGRHTFEGCKSLKTVVLPINIAGVDNYAFRNCTSLESITFPGNKVKVSIHRGVFDSCVSLETVVLPSTIFYIGDSAFCNCTRLKEIYLTEGTDSVCNHSFHNCRSLKRLEIPSTMERIGDSAFMGCEQLDSVYVRIREPYVFGTDAFKDISARCVLMVPYGMRQDYINAGWTEQVFRGGVREMPEPEGIQAVRVKKSAGRYYDLQGREVSKPRHGGIYIRNGRKEKVK